MINDYRFELGEQVYYDSFLGLGRGKIVDRFKREYCWKIEKIYVIKGWLFKHYISETFVYKIDD